MRSVLSARRLRPAAVLLSAGVVCLALVPATTAEAVRPAPSAETVTPPVSAAAKQAAARITRKLGKRTSGGALGRDTSVRVWDQATGRTLFKQQAGEGQLPASNMKLVTAANALEQLGADTRFPTRVTAGAAAGSIVLVGGGDALLRSRDVAGLARRTADGLRAQAAVAGTPLGAQKVYVDDSLFAAPSSAPGWRGDYVGRYIQPVRALSTLGMRSSDTSLATARHFAKQLAANGVPAEVKGRASGRDDQELARFEGHPVSTAVDGMLVDSNNQIAETLYRQVAVAMDRPATWSGAAAAARASLKELGVPVTRLRLLDGSGLSRSNRITGDALVTLLRVAAERDSLDGLADGLPVAGRSGTLERRYRSHPTSCARGRVLAKTGYIDGVIALSGYAMGVDGRMRAFSIMVNHKPRRHAVSTVQRKVDTIAATVVGCR